MSQQLTNSAGTTIETCTALRLTDVHEDDGFRSEQFDLLSDDYLGADDNGGNPDGPTWLLWPVNPLSDDVKAAVDAGAELVLGYEAAYHTEAWNEVMEQFVSGEAWSAVSSAETACFTDQLDAFLSQATYERMSEDDDLDTLAFRVNRPEVS